jgi:hypothetical protein
MTARIRLVFGGCLGIASFVLGAGRAEAAYSWPNKEAPPPEMREKSNELQVLYSLSDIRLRNTRLVSTSSPTPLPSTGTVTVQSFFDIFTEISINGGASFSPVAAYHAPSQLSYTTTDGVDYGTEMKNLSGTLQTALGPVFIRESPTKLSTGHATIGGGGGGGGYQIDSFFDVFTELSFDGGQSWTPQWGIVYDNGGGGTLVVQDAPMRVEGVPEPGTVTLLIAGALCAAGYLWRRKK